MSTYVAVFALVLAYVALVAAYIALRTLAKLRRATTLLARGTRSGQARESLIEATNRHAELTATALEEIAELRTELAQAREQSLAAAQAGAVEVAGVLRNIALVRYDAFTGVSGRMSFSLALLDEQGDGVTITSIAGQSDTRVYAKGIASGRSSSGGDNDLSPEEQQAVASAVHKQRTGLLSRKAG
ncbi:MAG: DUF4446 family protein [Jatrophihabitantaceae bacterium]